MMVQDLLTEKNSVVVTVSSTTTLGMCYPVNHIIMTNKYENG